MGKHHTVIFVTRPELKTIVEEMKMLFSPSLEKAIRQAAAMGKKKIAFIPNGVSVIIDT